MDLTDAELRDIADELDTDVSTLQSEAVKDCAESVYADRDVSKSQAFAICQDMENEGQLQSPMITLAELRNPDAIERVEEDGTVRYRNIMLLAPGVWGDAASQRAHLYSAENTIPALAENVADNTLNLFHEQDNETTQVGELDDSSLFIGEDDGALYGDLVLSMDNAASEFADEALQDALESGGRVGLQGPSLEIAEPDHVFNADAGVPEVMDGVIRGVGLVGLGVSPGPGSEDAAFAEQTRERAVALASDDDTAVLTQQHHAMDIDELRERLESEDIALAEDADEDDLRELAAALDIELQEDDDMDEESDGEMDDDNDEDEGDDVSDDDEEDTDVDIDLEGVAEQVDSLSEQVSTNAERIEAIAEATETLQQGEVDLAELAESVATLQESIDTYADADRVAELAERVDTIAENLEEPTSLASMGGVDAPEDDDAVYVDFGRTTIDKEY